MPENTREDFLHWQFKGTHVLFSGVTSIWLGCIIAVVICVVERSLTYMQDRHWTPSLFSRNRFSTALWRTILYWIITLLRLSQMLVVMTFNAGLLLVTVTTLAACQFVIEVKRHDQHRIQDSMGSRNSYSRIDLSEDGLLAKPRDTEECH